MVNKIISIIFDINGMSVKENTKLFDDGIMDSFSIFNDLIPAIEEEYNIKYQAIDILPENFETPQMIADFIKRAKERQKDE